MTEPVNVRVERRDDGVATLTIDAPKKLNPIDFDSCAGLQAGLDTLSADGRTRVAVLRGAGKAFSGGGDIDIIQRGIADAPRAIGPMIDAFHRVILAIKAAPFPVVAVVHGAAAGGGLSLALACDLVLATRSAKLVIAYPKLGTSTDGGLSWSLTRRLGALRALDLMLLGSAVTAEQALAMGLVSRVLDDDAVDAQVDSVLQTLLAQPVQAMREIKQLVVGAETNPLSTQLDAERDAFLRCAATPEFAERVDAFLSKRR